MTDPFAVLKEIAEEEYQKKKRKVASPRGPIKRKPKPSPIDSLTDEELAAVYDEILIDRELGARSLRDYIRICWQIIEPARPYIDDAWHSDVIADHLQGLVEGDLKRLLIAIPPGFGKSVWSCVMLPTWAWIHQPHWKMIFGAYNFDFSKENSRRCIKIIKSNRWQKRWGHLFNLTKSDVSRVETSMGGRRSISSVGGQTLGLRANLAVADDPMNIQQVNSEIERSKVHYWWMQGMRTRGHVDLRELVIQQRLHDRDLIGYLLSEVGGYEYLCYDASTEILTERGWTKFPELVKTDKVAQVDPDNLVMDFVKPISYVVRDYVGKMLRINSCVDLLVTPEHRMVIKSLHDFNNKSSTDFWRVCSARELPKQFYIPQAVHWDAKDIDTITLGTYNISGDTFAKFMGVWLAEGCVTKQKDIRYTSGYAANTVITQQCGEFASEIRAFLDTLPMHWGTRTGGTKRPDMLHFKCYDRSMHKYLTQFGKSGDKFVPTEIKNMSGRQILLFLEWYGKGDGHTLKRNANSYAKEVLYTSKSKRLIDDVQELLLRVGRTGSVVAKNNGKAWTIKTRITKNKEYKWYGLIEADKNISFEDYSGNVYCVNVPTGALLVRRNGKPVVSGNCLPAEYDPKRQCVVRNVEGDTFFKDPRKNENDLLFPQLATQEYLNSRKKGGELSTSQANYSALYQQDPVPAGGYIIKTDWFRFYSDTPEKMYKQCKTALLSCDPAVKDKDTSSYTVAQIWGVNGVNIYLIDQIRQRLSFTGILDALQRLIIKWNDMDGPMLSAKLIEGKANGPAILDTLKNKIPGLIEYTGDDDKEARTHAITWLWEAGNVYVPGKEPEGDEGSPNFAYIPWMYEWYEEITRYPKSAYTDQAVTMSQALEYFTSKMKAPIGMPTMITGYGHINELQREEKVGRLTMERW